MCKFFKFLFKAKNKSDNKNNNDSFNNKNKKIIIKNNKTFNNYNLDNSNLAKNNTSNNLDPEKEVKNKNIIIFLKNFKNKIVLCSECKSSVKIFWKQSLNDDELKKYEEYKSRADYWLNPIKNKHETSIKKHWNKKFDGNMTNKKIEAKFNSSDYWKIIYQKQYECKTKQKFYWNMITKFLDNYLINPSCDGEIFCLEHKLTFKEYKENN